MDASTIEKRFTTYIDKIYLSNATRLFLLVYIELLLIFDEELPEHIWSAVLERQKQLRGEKYDETGFHEIRLASRAEVDGGSKSSHLTGRCAAINKMIFCIFIDSDESDLFYLVEPMFDFARTMKVSPDQLRIILEAGFVGFRV